MHRRPVGVSPEVYVLWKLRNLLLTFGISERAFEGVDLVVMSNRFNEPNLHKWMKVRS